MSTLLKSMFISEAPKVAEELYSEILQYCTRRIAKKNEILYHPGKMNEFFFFVSKGYIRKYLIVEGNECTINFAFEGECFALVIPDTPKVKRFANRKFPDAKEFLYYVQAMERSELIIINNKYKEQIFSKMPSFYCYLYHSWNKEYKTIKYFNDMNCEDRYKWILEERPGIIQRVPMKLIASYLNMSPITLSRIRSGL